MAARRLKLTWVYGSSRRALGHDFPHENALLETAVHFHPQSGEVGTAQRNQPRSGRLDGRERERERVRNRELWMMRSRVDVINWVNYGTYGRSVSVELDIARVM